MANEAEFVSPLGAEALLFRRLQATEALGRLPEWRVELLRPSTSKAITPTELLGKKAGIKLRLQDDTSRHINGIVTRFERGGEAGRFDIYQLELAPWLWQLQLGADCRIYQDMTAPEIIDEVFARYGSAGQVEKKLSGSFRKRPYTVQYRESDFNFVSRLMEDEGIYYFFKHTADQHTLVLCNHAGAHVPMPGDSLVWGEAATGDQLREDIVTRWSLAHQLRPLKFTHTDYAAEAPTTDLLGTALRTAPYPKPNELEVYDYPSGSDDVAMGTDTGTKAGESKRTAQLRVDAFESGHVVANGVTPWRSLTVGSTFTLDEHAAAGGYLVTRAAYVMEFAGYEANPDKQTTSYSCRFDAVPKAVHFQPERVTDRPVVQGPQTAVVVGAEGDEIHTDKYGRVKLQFHWDRLGTSNEKSSCWVRVSQPWASKQFGMIALPRVGDEVVVEFLEGNPDRPLVTGRVYNGDNMPPYALPAQATVTGIKSQSSKGKVASKFNELRFDDKKDAEHVWFHAEKDYHQWVKNDAFRTVQNDLWTDVAKNTAHKIGENLTLDVGKVATIAVGEDTHVEIGADMNLKITGAMSVDVTEKTAVKVGNAIAVSAAQALDVKAGAAMNLSATSSLHLKGMGVVIDGGTQLCIKAGGAFITLGPAGVVIQGPLVKINSGGAAGSANDAAQAAPTAPKKPATPKDNADPMKP